MGVMYFTEDETEKNNYLSKILKRYQCTNHVNMYEKYEEYFHIVSPLPKEVNGSECYFKMPMKE